eukprot:288136-Prymnesium_polylepis.1
MIPRDIASATCCMLSDSQCDVFRHAVWAVRKVWTEFDAALHVDRPVSPFALAFGWHVTVCVSVSAQRTRERRAKSPAKAECHTRVNSGTVLARTVQLNWHLARRQLGDPRAPAARPGPPCRLPACSRHVGLGLG